MKHLVIVLFILISTNASATHWLQYFVFVETEYVQGPWTGNTQLEESNYRYLSAIACEGSFGTVELELIGAFLSKLKEQKPKRYRWKYDVSFENEIVTIKPLGKIDNWQTVKNEITATMALNSFSTIKFEFKDSTVISTIDDLTLPYMDLRSPTPNSPSGPVIIRDTVEINSNINANDAESNDEQSNGYLFWFILSGVLNVLLVAVLLRRKRK